MQAFPECWPERWVREMRNLPPHGWLTKGRDGQGMWAGIEPLLVQGGGRITTDFDEFTQSPYARQLNLVGSLMDQKMEGFGSALASQHLVCTYLVGRWIADGKRYYALDDATANALMDTDFSSFPTADLRLPMPTFWLALPKSIRWTMLAEFVDSPHAQDEPMQYVEGFLVGGMNMQPNGQFDALKLIIAGRSKYVGEDAILWYSCPMPFPTLELVSQCRTTKQLDPSNYKMFGAKDWTPDVELIGWATKMIVGLCLYVQCTHPQLQVHTPILMPQVTRKKKHKEVWKEYDSSTRCHVTYVGGPEHGHIKGTNGPREVVEGRRKSPRPHTRMGHIHRYWVGSGPDRHLENRWIRPVRVGDWSTLFEWQEPVRTIFKTRPAERIQIEEVDNADAS